MATVFLAHDNKFDTNVAVKVLSKEFVHIENIRKRFLAEARNMFKMSHPNIIKVTDLIDEGDTVAFVMEYIEGETLKEYIDRKGILSDAEIKNLFTQMLDAVGYVHKQKLVHRDIKPSNFMITPEGQIKLMDFGIAKTTDISSAEHTQTGTGVQMGTPMYMSPEQVKSSKDVSYTTDIYSLGVVLWQMIMGKKPYDTNELSLAEIQVNIIKEYLPITSSIFDHIIQKATQKNPEQRYQNIQDFKNAIKHPINETNFDQTIANKEIVEEEEIVVAGPSKKTNSFKLARASSISLNYIIIVVIIVSSFLVLYDLIIENDISTLENIESTIGEPIPEIGNSIIYTVFNNYYASATGEDNNNYFAVPIVVYFNGKYLDPPHCRFYNSNSIEEEECEKSKELLFPSVQAGSRLFEIVNGIQTNSIYVSGYENFGYSDWTLFSGIISDDIKPLLLTDNHKIGRNRLAQISDTPVLEENRSLLGIIDIDGDGMPERIYEVSDYEGTSYEILSFINKEWKVVYNGGYQGV